MSETTVTEATAGETTAGGTLGAEAQTSQAGTATGAAAGGTLGAGTPPAAAAVTPEAADAAKAGEDKKLADEKAATDKAAAEKKAADDKVAADAKAKAELDKAYEAWKPGERNPEALKEFTTIAKEHGLKPEQAEKFLALNDKLEAAAAKARTEALDTERQGWFKELKSDKEFGGVKYDATVREANKAFEKYAGPELTKFLKATGLDAHPELMKAFARVGAAMRNDSLAGTESNGSTKSPQQALAELYRTNSPGLFPKQ